MNYNYYKSKTVGYNLDFFNNYSYMTVLGGSSNAILFIIMGGQIMMGALSRK